MARSRFKHFFGNAMKGLLLLALLLLVTGGILVLVWAVGYRSRGGVPAGKEATYPVLVAKWEWWELPNYDVLAEELPKHDGEVRLGEWKLGSWTATLYVHQCLEAGSVEAKIAGMEGGGFLTTLVVCDEQLLRGRDS